MSLKSAESTRPRREIYKLRQLHSCHKQGEVPSPSKRRRILQTVITNTTTSVTNFGLNGPKPIKHNAPMAPKAAEPVFSIDYSPRSTFLRKLKQNGRIVKNPPKKLVNSPRDRVHKVSVSIKKSSLSRKTQDISTNTVSSRPTSSTTFRSHSNAPRTKEKGTDVPSVRSSPRVKEAGTNPERSSSNVQLRSNKNASSSTRDTGTDPPSFNRSPRFKDVGTDTPSFLENNPSAKNLMTTINSARSRLYSSATAPAKSSISKSQCKCPSQIDSEVLLDLHINERQGMETMDCPQQAMQELRDFRLAHWFDCHADPRKIQTLPNHSCSHQYILNERLMPQPTKANKHGQSICKKCGLPAFASKNSKHEVILENKNKKVKFSIPNPYNVDPILKSTVESRNKITIPSAPTLSYIPHVPQRNAKPLTNAKPVQIENKKKIIHTINCKVCMPRI